MSGFRGNASLTLAYVDVDLAVGHIKAATYIHNIDAYASYYLLLRRS